MQMLLDMMIFCQVQGCASLSLHLYGSSSAIMRWGIYHLLLGLHVLVLLVPG